MGEKMAWILKEGYGETVPAPSAKYRARLSEIRAGNSPFLDQADFHKAANLYRNDPETLSPEQREWLER